MSFSLKASRRCQPELLHSAATTLSQNLSVPHAACTISSLLLDHYKAELCEISILQEDNRFRRLSIARREHGKIFADQTELAKQFPIPRDHYETSLQGYCVKYNKSY